MEAKVITGYCLIALSLMACQSRPEKIKIGVDHCSECKMLITDDRFGGELISPKGRVYKFDDMVCLKNFLTKVTDAVDQYKIYAIHYNTGQLILIEDAKMYYSEHLRSPMGGNVAVFATDEERENFSTKMEGRNMDGNY